MVFPTFFNLSLNLAIRSSWSEPQSAPSLVFADCIELDCIGCKDYNQPDFGGDHLVMSMCRVLCCWKRLFAVISAFSWHNSISLFPASFRTPRPNLPVTPGVSWLPNFLFQSPIMKRISFPLYMGSLYIYIGFPGPTIYSLSSQSNSHIHTWPLEKP